MPVLMTFDPQHRFLYSANSTSDAVYSIDQTSGALSFLASYPNFGGPIVVDPSGKYLYAASVVNDSITSFAIDQASGLLTAVGSPLVVSGNLMDSLAVNPAGTMLYVSNVSATGLGQIVYVSIDSATGVLSLASAGPWTDTSTKPGDIVIDSSGAHLYLGEQDGSGIKGFTIQADGTLASPDLGTCTGVTVGPYSLVISPTSLYFTDPTTNDVGGVSLSGGTLSGTPIVLGTIPGRFVAMDPTGNYLLVSDATDSLLWSYKINSDGTLTSLTSIACGTNAIGVATCILP